ncbi:MAG: S-layer homology domain-containing protein, partial [Defluviitaleaceae bacterium]|nr:S-layer homology domain-containing protein [Defluviitaleaceae bacterium]
SITRFVMPAGNVTATANWQQTSTSNGSGPGIGSDAGPGFPGGWTGGGGGGTTGTAAAAEGVTPPAVLGYTPFIEEHIAYISGFPDGTFRPSQAITRAEVSMILFRLLDSNAKYSPQANHFSDVQAGRWYAQAINYLAGRNILAGEHNGTFRPNDSMTRAELAAVMSRFFELGESGMSSFYDVNANHWAFRYIMNAEGRGWVSGYDDRTFRPNNAIIRAEAVTLINRVLNRNPNPATIREHLAGVTVFTDITQGHWAFYQVMEASISHEFEIDANGLEIWTYIVSLPNSN